MEHDLVLSEKLQLARPNPKNDFLFKRLFGEEEGKPLLISLLNAVLRRGGKPSITGVSIMNEVRLNREMADDKEAVMDIMCEVDYGQEQANVEMQIRRFERMDYRSLFYTAKMLTGSIRQGQSYFDLKKTIGINILDHRYLPLDKYHSTFHLYEDELQHYMLTDILELHFIECPKFQEFNFNINDPLHRWLRFLEQDTTREQLEELMNVDEMIKEAEARLNYLISDEETRSLYARREKALFDKASWLYQARKEGLEEGVEIGIAKGLAKGIEQGIEQGVQRAALKMLEKGLEVEVVSEITGLAAEQVELLRGKV